MEIKNISSISSLVNHQNIVLFEDIFDNFIAPKLINRSLFDKDDLYLTRSLEFKGIIPNYINPVNVELLKDNFLEIENNYCNINFIYCKDYRTLSWQSKVQLRCKNTKFCVNFYTLDIILIMNVEDLKLLTKYEDTEIIKLILKSFVTKDKLYIYERPNSINPDIIR